MRKVGYWTRQVSGNLIQSSEHGSGEVTQGKEDFLSPTPPPRASSNTRCEPKSSHHCSPSWQVPPSSYARHIHRFANTSAQSSEARLYTFSDETKTKLRKFRLGTSRAKDPQAVIYEIDKKTLEVRQADDDVYSDVQSLADELPDHAPRFVLLSYPLTLDSGRLSVPYVMLYYLPITCNSEVKMLYAGAKELMRNTSEVNRIIEIDSAEDLEEIEKLLKDV
ncbi:glia maturation factor beta [Alternaria burnsii]|uniref:Glia maturation factor beta n=1 Tax=Alternaria burnsii TaxID=1187904 RepID=A0A8H7ECC8_9PLEO|nr:glia maturation factor beta [Alternaria burnsii]KAF7670781.1 glia maturation factor beta [Alternaria burnsii]